MRPVALHLYQIISATQCKLVQRAMLALRLRQASHEKALFFGLRFWTAAALAMFHMLYGQLWIIDVVCEMPSDISRVFQFRYGS